MSKSSQRLSPSRSPGSLNKQDKEPAHWQMIGLQCISPGLSSEKMDNKMLSTIRKSEDIAKDQRQQIEKLINPETISQNISPTEPDFSINKHNNNNHFTPSSTDHKNMDQNNDNKKNKSLKRNKVPPPLNIGIQKGLPHFSFIRDSNLKSAPPNITHQKGILRPRVQYLGKSYRNRNQHQHLQYLQYLQQQQQCMYQVSTPLIPTMIPQSCHPTLGPQMNSYYHYCVYPPLSPFPMTAVSTSSKNYNNSAKVATNLPHHYDPVIDTNKQGIIGTKDIFLNNPTHSLNTRESFFKKDRDSNGNGSSCSEPDDENVEIAIEDELSTDPSSVISGEIKIQSDKFAFDFPNSNQESIDKKMFMSICDKVWDECQMLIHK